MATYYSPPPPYSVTPQGMMLQPMAPPAPSKVVVVQQSPPQPAPATTINVISGAQGNCRHCQSGHVVLKRDTFWLVILVALAVLTFPFGLVFCCFIPCCTWEQVCTNCRRRA
uniref:Membrane protein BRI3 n=1 Tax=Plectus sambesii TaxID=2011161 RepID=A0A914VGG8_9BILA